MTAEPSSTRARAAQTLDRILVEGAYSNIVVARDPGTDGDHALYQRLVYEALRQIPAIDQAIERAGSRGIDRIQREVLGVLRIATGEIRYLRRAPHSAVSQSVDAVRELGKPKAAGFVNAVLRSVGQQRDEPVEADAYHGLPSSLFERLEVVFGDTLTDFIAASNSPAPIGIRSRDGNFRGDDSPVPGVTYATKSMDIASLVADGSIDVLDPASAAVVAALDPVEGNQVLDLAAAPGGKTRMISDLLGGSGAVVATDSHYRRLSSARTRSKDISRITWLVADAAKPPFRSSSFDR
ncbi:MAG: class I SAM-dependent methyltransferase, partial [Actinomycetia bacterium]|nr:class I SAM-dependent methyltransferase [Actinomycetes bacterium]